MVSVSAYSSALENISEGCTPRALATRSRLSAVTLRSPRSILPMWDRSIPALYAKASCDTLCALRTSRIAWPKALRRRSSSSVRGLLDTDAPSQQVHQQATVFTTHFIVDVHIIITHDHLKGITICYFPEHYLLPLWLPLRHRHKSKRRSRSVTHEVIPNAWTNPVA